MNGSIKDKVFDIIIISFLLTLILVRFLCDSEDFLFISFLNYLGLIISFVSLYSEMYREFFKSSKFALITGCFVIILVPLIVFAALIFSEIVILSTKCNDIILLVTLLITLPNHFYVRLISKLITD